ncbi:hypothetical protein D9C73_009568 [Collichthys lucidus]|uniref:Uncharacterized protein n=1 Tax=Collichthys lucidus TaxID=240159 RepID=A0A4U5UPJ4_COLLU|nr:hypothetical protein D9C73_009568 [Collichthys lucidus]
MDTLFSVFAGLLVLFSTLGDVSGQITTDCRFYALEAACLCGKRLAAHEWRKSSCVRGGFNNRMIHSESRSNDGDLALYGAIVAIIPDSGFYFNACAAVLFIMGEPVQLTWGAPRRVSYKLPAESCAPSVTAIIVVVFGVVIISPS